MKLRSDQLKTKAEDAGVSVDQLAQAIERDSLKGEDAIKAVRNWMAGRDHPRAKKADIDRVSEVLGVLPKDIVRFTSMVRHHRGSPKKAKLVTDLIKGKNASEASDLLRFYKQRAAVNVKKALDAALAEAEQSDVDTSRLFISESRVDNGKHIKRFRPKDRGRAHPILKRTSHITVSVEERA